MPVIATVPTAVLEVGVSGSAVTDIYPCNYLQIHVQYMWHDGAGADNRMTSAVIA